jgi:TrkA domain protein
LVTTPATESRATVALEKRRWAAQPSVVAGRRRPTRPSVAAGRVYRTITDAVAKSRMTITESDLPGVGKKFEIDLDDGEMIVVIHNTGKRELFYRPAADADSEKTFEFGDDLARTIGSIIEGAHFQPVEPATQETTLPGGVLLEWYELHPGASLIGETLASADVRDRTGLTIVAIQRDDETIASPPADTTLREGDTVIGVGSRDDCDAFEALLAE